jgi:hypothetical protein
MFICFLHIWFVNCSLHEFSKLSIYGFVFQAGMALYKIVPKNPYYFWSVMSLIMQVSLAVRMKLFSLNHCLLNILGYVLQWGQIWTFYILSIDFSS